MNSPSANLFFSRSEERAAVRVEGRANCTISPRFKALVCDLLARGARELIIDLEQCSTMDSTFLGVLAGFCVEIVPENQIPTAPVLDLYRPNARILDLLDNLGIAPFFRMTQELPAGLEAFTAVAPDPLPASKKELAKTCLDAHLALMVANPENVPKFKDVTQFLSEDAKRD